MIEAIAEFIHLPAFRVIGRGLQELMKNPVVQQVGQIATHTIPFIFGAYFIGYGVAEMVCDFNAHELDADNLPPPAEGVISALAWFYERIDEFEEAVLYKIIHGSLFIVTGITEIAIAANYFGAAILAPLVPALCLLGEMAFMGANIIMLIHNFKIFCLATVILDSEQDPAKRAQAERARISAVLGIFSALSYIIAIALMLSGVGTAWALFFMILGLVAGSVKILYDMAQNFYFNPENV